MEFPQTIVALAPILAPFLTKVSSYLSLRIMALRGFEILVKTMEGPKKTSSSHFTPV